MNDDSTDATLLQREFAALHESGAVVDVYRERLVRGGMLGRVLQWSDHVLILERLDEQYEYDGLTAIRPSDLTRLRARDRELKTIEQISSPSKAAILDEVALLEISASITKLAQRFSTVTVFTEGLDPDLAFVGEPEDLDDDFLALRAWGTARNGDDYRLLLRLSEVTRVDADTNCVRRLRDVRNAQRVSSDV